MSFLVQKYHFLAIYFHVLIQKFYFLPFFFDCKQYYFLKVQSIYIFNIFTSKYLLILKKPLFLLIFIAIFLITFFFPGAHGPHLGPIGCPIGAHG